MAPNVTAMLEAPIIELDVIDSTNNYAMQLIDADTAQAGLTITAKQQSQGKGQRGRQWIDLPDASLLMSIITIPRYNLTEQFLFNASVAVSIANVLQKLNEHWDIRIKWPNDIIVNDKKAGGVLIENVLRGSNWTYSIIGFGLNIKHEHFPSELPYATSLKIMSGKDYDIKMLRDMLREKILEYVSIKWDAKEIMQQYNDHLYGKGQIQTFTLHSNEWQGIIQGADVDGTLIVQLSNGNIVKYVHGTVMWKWE